MGRHSLNQEMYRLTDKLAACNDLIEGVSPLADRRTFVNILKHYVETLDDLIMVHVKIEGSDKRLEMMHRSVMYASPLVEDWVPDNWHDVDVDHLLIPRIQLLDLINARVESRINNTLDDNYDG